MGFPSKIFLSFVFLIIANSSPKAQSVYVPLNHRVYRFVERYEAKGVLKNELIGTKPLSRANVAELLYEIQKRSESDIILSKVDSELLLFYEQEFREELEEIDSSCFEIEKPAVPGLLGAIRGGMLLGLGYENGRNLLAINRAEFSLFGDIIAYQDNNITDSDSLDSLDKVFSYTTGVRIRGAIGDNLGFFVDVRNSKEWGSRFYRKGRDITALGLGWVSNRKTHQFHDETIAYLIARFSHFELEFGKNLNKWGPGFRGGLLLSDNATSYDLVKLKTKVWRFSYSHLFGSLVQFPRIIEEEFDEDSGRKNKFAKKYLVAHRLEVNVFDGVKVGIQESVVYGQREMEFAYLNPIMFLRSAEHFLGDQDNALMGADITLNILDGWKWYGEFLMDDIFISRLGTKWWGNKFGYVAGTLWEDPLGLSNTAVRLEYTRIKPFVYTHRFPINVYKHYNSGLGHQLQPNSDELYLSAQQQISRKFFYSAEYVYSRHGINTEDQIIGGSIDTPLPSTGNDYLNFLEGDVERINWFRFKLSYELYRNLFIASELEVRSGSNFTIAGVPGQDFLNKRFFISVGLNK